MSSDCTVSAFLTEMHTSRGTDEATAFYTMNARDRLHPKRIEWIGAGIYAEGGQMPDDYTAAITARVAAYRERKAEQAAETDAARDKALEDAARYMATLDLNAGRVVSNHLKLAGLSERERKRLVRLFRSIDTLRRIAAQEFGGRLG